MASIDKTMRFMSAMVPIPLPGAWPAIVESKASLPDADAWADDFSLPARIAAHRLMPVAAGLFKPGYVIRLASHHALGKLAVG